MNAQEIFSKSRAHVIKQGQPAVTYDDVGRIRCQYRLPLAGKVLKCAIGCFIRKSNYTPTIENMTITTDVLLRLPDGFADHAKLLDGLQEAHDNAAEDTKTNPADFIEMYKLNMESLASFHGLKNV